MSVVISRTDLARNTRDIVERVRRGQLVVVQSYGQEQIVLLDALDYRILRALVHYALQREEESSAAPQGADLATQVIAPYLDGTISLSKAAERMGMSRFELMGRFERLGLPLRLGPASLTEAQEEVQAVRQPGTAPR
jgi:prevent-host-death family protein